MEKTPIFLYYESKRIMTKVFIIQNLLIRSGSVMPLTSLLSMKQVHVMRYMCMYPPWHQIWYSMSLISYPCHPGPVSLSDKTSYRKMSWSLEAARFVFRIIISLLNLTGTSAALLPRYLSNFKPMRWFKLSISRLQNFTRSYDKTFYRILERGPVSVKSSQHPVSTSSWWFHDTRFPYNRILFTMSQWYRALVFPVLFPRKGSWSDSRNAADLKGLSVHVTPWPKRLRRHDVHGVLKLSHAHFKLFVIVILIYIFQTIIQW